MTTIRSRAPLRLGLGGGGTDVSPYSDMYTGCVLNATIDLYAYCTLTLNTDQKITFKAHDLKEEFSTQLKSKIPLDGHLQLHKAIYNRVIQDFNHGNPIPVNIETLCEAPPGSGLGSSSTMVVAQLTAYAEFLHLPLGEYDIAKLAFDIERKDAGLSGGKQDQYAATFGGFNFIEFRSEDQVIVNPLRIKPWIVNELEYQMVLYYTGKSRQSAQIIDQQIQAMKGHNTKSLEALHSLKADAHIMKDSLLKGDLQNFAHVLGKSWQAKKLTASGVSNSHIDEIFNAAVATGAFSGKVSGAGGGGFMLFMIAPEKRLQLIEKLSQFNGQVINFHFTYTGAEAWRTQPFSRSE